jgi:RNA recognition motif-containing protein
MFNGYSWQTRILEVRPDRLPPDLDNPTSVNGFASGISNVPSLLGASPFAPAGQNNSSPLAATLGEDVDYSSFYLYDGLGASGAGGRNLFVGNLPFHCQWQDLKDLFRQAGTIIRADVALGQDGRSRGFGTVVFATDTDAEHAVKMFHGYEYNGRQLKVHYDKFSQTTQTTTDPASPTLQSTYHHNPSFGCHLINPPNHIPMPIGYHFDLGTHSGPNSPYGCPPNVSMAQPHSSQAHPVSVDHLSASFASTSLGENTSASDDRQNSSQSIPRHHHNNSNTT